MEELIFGVLEAAVDFVVDVFSGEAVGEVVEGVAEGAAIVGAAYLVYTVAEKITQSNLPELIRKAIHDKMNDLAKKALGTALTACVKEIKPNEISLSVLQAQCKALEGKDIKITSSAGVDSNLKPGMTIQSYL